MTKKREGNTHTQTNKQSVPGFSTALFGWGLVSVALLNDKTERREETHEERGTKSPEGSYFSYVLVSRLPLLSARHTHTPFSHVCLLTHPHTVTVTHPVLGSRLGFLLRLRLACIAYGQDWVV